MLGTHTASVTGSEVREERHPTGSQAHSRLGQARRDLLEGVGIPVVEAARQYTDTAPDLSFPSVRAVKRLLQWTQVERTACLTLAGIFLSREELKAIVSKDDDETTDSNVAS